jgi:NADH-quinone oxidoreductase subunit L
MFQCVWLIPLLPLIAFAVIVLFANPYKTLSSGLATGAIAVSWLLSWGVAATAIVQNLRYDQKAFHLLTNWIPTGSTWLTIGVQVDPLTVIMLLMVPFVCLMIFIYSWSYMGYGTEAVDPRYSRFFAYISLFAAAMLGLVLSDNLFILFMFWEIMGLCSYLLISFWFEKDYPDPGRITPRQAGLKAFIVTKIGDIFFLLGILYLYSQTGSLSYDVIFDQGVLHTLAQQTVVLPLLGTWSVASVIGLLIFGGAVGKSAQFPLHVWLPDAMEGPTPVSALIHAATMVSAGVYLLARIFPLFYVVIEVEGHNPAMRIIAFIGAFTALFFSLIALTQDDIKRVLAYSTISQLGYMVTTVGIGVYVAGVFHMITHAFFKALLFMDSGSVIRGMEHGLHSSHENGDPISASFDPNDMRNMGGLYRRQPITFWTFFASAMSLVGLPLLTAGFWSKEEILSDVYETHHPIVFWALVATAGLTALYTMRQICLTFLGQPRTKAAEHALESAPSMTVPAIILALIVMGLGWIGIPTYYPVIGGLIPDWFEKFVTARGESVQLPQHFVWQPLAVGLLFALGGLALGWLAYGWRPMQVGEMDRVEAIVRRVGLGWLYNIMCNRFYLDALYQATFVRGAISLANILFEFDNRWVIDPIINGVGRLTVWSGQKLRLIQTGRIQNYMLVAFISLLVLLGIYSIR